MHLFTQRVIASPEPAPNGAQGAGRGNLTPSLPSPLEGEGEGGGDCFVIPHLRDSSQ